MNKDIRDTIGILIAVVIIAAVILLISYALFCEMPCPLV